MGGLNTAREIRVNVDGPIVALRAAAQVLLVAANTVTLAAFQRSGTVGSLLLSAALGFGISWVWWANTRAASAAAGQHRAWYAGGAALGTALGAVLGLWLTAI